MRYFLHKRSLLLLRPIFVGFFGGVTILELFLALLYSFNTLKWYCIQCQYAIKTKNIVLYYLYPYLLIIYLITPRSKVLLQKVTGSQLVK